MRAQPVRYRSDDEDSARWEGFPFRPGDIVISTRSKSGTTWMQMICALLVFQTPDLPAPLSELSPWLDWLICPRDEVFARLEAQPNRRFIKTHTPLDGVPIDQRATYIVVGRHPLDLAVSLYHQGANINRGRLRQLTAQSEPESAEPEQAEPTQPEPAPAAPTQPEPATAAPTQPRPPLREWLLSWIDSDDLPADQLDSLPGVMWHLSDAWARRAEPNVILAHYDDLLADLGGEMRRLADRLRIMVPAGAWPDLVRSATFSEMRDRAARRAPDPAGVLKDPLAFFRRGTSGAGREVLTTGEMTRYYARTAQLASPDLLTWLHREHAP